MAWLLGSLDFKLKLQSGSGMHPVAAILHRELTKKNVLHLVSSGREAWEPNLSGHSRLAIVF